MLEAFENNMINYTIRVILKRGQHLEGYGTCEIYMYVTDKKYNIYSPELANDDIIEFNRFGNVRFEEE